MDGCEENMKEYLCGNKGGLYDGFMSQCPKDYWNFTLFKVLADMFHDFNGSANTYIKNLFTKDGAITEYSTRLYKTLKGKNDLLLQNKFFNFQFAKGVRGAIREKTYFKNLLKNMFAQKPAEMERAFTIIGWVVYKQTDIARADAPDDARDAVESLGNCQQSTDVLSKFKKVPWLPKKENLRVAITRNMVYDIGVKPEPITVDVAVGKDPLSMHVFKCPEGKKPWFASPYLCNTLANIFDPATFVSGPVEGFGKFPLLELIWLGNVKTEDKPGINSGWKERLNSCIGVLGKCLQDYFNKVLLPILREKNTADEDEVVVTIDNTKIQAFLLNVYENPGKTMAEFFAAGQDEQKPKITFRVTTKAWSQFNFEMEPFANTITAIEKYVMKQTRNDDGTPTTTVNTNNFLNKLQKFANAITGSVPADGMLEPKVSCFFCAIKGLGDWIQTQYNKGIIPYLVQVNDAAFNIGMDDNKIDDMADVRNLPTIENADTDIAVNNILEQTVDKFVCGDVIATTSDIADTSSKQVNLIAAGLSAPEWLGENLAEVDVPGFNESFKYWILYFPDGRMKKDLWEKADEKLPVFFPEVSLRGIPTPIRVAEDRQSLIATATADDQQIFTISGESITVLLPVYGSPLTLEQNLTNIPNNADPTTLNSLIELMQRNYDLQHMYSETTTKAKEITEVLQNMLYLYNKLFSQYEQSFQRMRERPDYNIWPTLTVKLRLIKTCNNFFIDSNIENMIAPILDFQILSQKLIEEMQRTVPGYTTTNRGAEYMNSALTELKEKGNELATRIQEIQTTLTEEVGTIVEIHIMAKEKEDALQKLVERRSSRGKKAEEDAGAAAAQSAAEEEKNMEKINRTVENIGGQLATLLNNIDAMVEDEDTVNEENNDVEAEEDTVLMAAADTMDAAAVSTEQSGGNYRHQSGGDDDGYDVELDSGLLPPPRPINISAAERQKMWDELAALTLNKKEYGAILTWNLLQLNHKYNYFKLTNTVMSQIYQLNNDIVVMEGEEVQAQNMLDAAAEEQQRMTKKRPAEELPAEELPAEELPRKLKRPFYRPTSPVRSLSPSKQPGAEPSVQPLSLKFNRGGKSTPGSSRRKHKNRNKTRKRKKRPKYTQKKGQKKRVQTRPRRKRRQKKRHTRK